MKKIIVIFLTTLSMALHAMDFVPQEKNQIKVFAVPGQNGLGSEADYISKALNIEEKNIHAVKTPHPIFSDLGQERCIAHLSQALKENQEDFILHATSQGTATVLNYLAENQEKLSKLKAVILESVLVSGNNSILHTAKCMMGLGFLTRRAYAHYWFSYITKFVFPFYSPTGKQVIKIADQLPKDKPIILIHSTKDPQLPGADTCALYDALKRKGNSVYLIQPDGFNHLWLGECYPYINQTILSILQKHRVLSSNREVTDQELKIYRPNATDAEANQEHFKSLLAKETNYKAFGKARACLMGGLFASLASLKLFVPRLITFVRNQKLFMSLVRHQIHCK